MDGSVADMKATIRKWATSYNNPKNVMAAVSRCIEFVLLSCDLVPLPSGIQELRDDPAEYLQGANTAASSVHVEKSTLDWGPEDYSQSNPPHEDIIDIVFSSTCRLDEDPESCTLTTSTLKQINLALITRVKCLKQE
ncbi:hypothetical protein BGX24_003853, partial [Mortierella sp. AD032]